MMNNISLNINVTSHPVKFQCITLISQTLFHSQLSGINNRIKYFVYDIPWYHIFSFYQETHAYKSCLAFQHSSK